MTEERPFYEVRARLELKPGYEAMMTFYSSSGKVVSREEATKKIIEIVKENNVRRSEGDYENAIDKLSEILLNPGNPYDPCLITEVTKALEEMATDPDSQYKVGLKAIESSVPNVPFWGIKMLAKSGHKESIHALMSMLSYDNGEGPDHWSYLISVAETASEALDVMVGKDSELQYQVGLEGLNSPWTSIIIWATQTLAKSHRKEAIQPLKEMLHKDQNDKIREALLKALKELGEGISR
jgi:hypothetical protein